MKLSIISFTERGMQLSERIAQALWQDAGEGQGPYGRFEACLYTKCKACMEESAGLHVLPVRDSVGVWAKGQMEEKNALLFIGACGIAVRAIAPSLTDKLHDAPVLVMDEMGKHVIPILSGHVGGANGLAVFLAWKTGAEPVITTATDLNGAFAVDVFAKKNGFSIAGKDGIAKISAKALAGQEVTMSVEPGHWEPLNRVGPQYEEPAGGTDIHCGDSSGGAAMQPEHGLPDGIRLVPYPPGSPVDIVVTSEEKEFDAAILLKPKEYVVGVGCKKGKSMEELGRFLTEKLGELGISAGQVFALASVSQKSREPGLAGWCQKERVPFFTYTAEELQQVSGEFHESPFVRAQVGVGNVCERAALKACEETAAFGPGGAWQGNGTLVLPKCAGNGMTIAIAKREWRVHFYGE